MTVLLYDDDPGGIAASLGVPRIDDTIGKRRFLARRILPTLVMGHPRGIVLDFIFDPLPGGDDATDALRHAVDAARAAGVPVYGLPGTGDPILPRCRTPDQRSCLDDVASPSGGRDSPGGVTTWPCVVDAVGTVATLATLIAEKVATSPARLRCLDPLPLVLPDVGEEGSDGNLLPWQQLTVRELLGATAGDGAVDLGLPDTRPLAVRKVLEGRLVVVGDARPLRAGVRDTVVVRDLYRGGEAREFPGATAHVLGAWRILGDEETERPSNSLSDPASPRDPGLSGAF